MRWRPTMMSISHRSDASDIDLPSFILTAMSLPPELLENIVLHLAGANNALCACLASARVFRLACEAQLFHTVVLQKRSPSREDTQSFIRGCVLFASTPYLVRFVKELRIQLTAEASEARLLETVLQRMAVHVVRLTILSPLVHINAAPPQFHMSVPTGLASAILHAMTRPQLQRIDIDLLAGMEASFKFLSATVKQNKLHLLDWNIVHVSVVINMTAASSFYASAGGLHTLAPLFSVVRHLWLTRMLTSYFPELPPLPSLRTFHLHALEPYSSYSADNGTISINPSYSHFLPEIAGRAPLLNTIRLSFNWRMHWNPTAGPPRALASVAEPWPMMGASVFEAVFPNVKRVECSYSLNWVRGAGTGSLLQEREAVQSWLRPWTAERMPGPANAGILSIVFNEI
ncbi:Exosome component Rrp46 [Mycena indigotica]|uniref:Exosome component Rrp46 n=1 Tax=Mycena indigotica TaxID=2126181 RepID=A0A8H6S6D5_9AGAR|nr:Exosome component Rrp46 [Mycena indigotica]KAF7292135.1 Exosome component Rrp46 [Mycena indigotica]